jgi:hypothetical protein
MRDTVLTFTALMLLAAACAQGDLDPDRELTVTRDDVTGEPGLADPVVEPTVGSDQDQGCIGEIFPVHFTETTAKVTGTVDCLRGGKLKFRACIHRRLIQSTAANLWSLVRPAWTTAPALLDELRGTEDCREVPEQVYEDPPLQMAIIVDVFCGRSQTRYSYTPSVQSVESFFPNVFLGDVWHTLAEGPAQIHKCGY